MLQKQKGFNQDQRFRDIINALELCIIVLKTDKKKICCHETGIYRGADELIYCERSCKLRKHFEKQFDLRYQELPK